MRSVTALLLASTLVLPLLSCGGTTSFGFQSDFQAVSGTVSSAHLSIVDGNVQITIVTLQMSGSFNQFAFCGDHVQQFPTSTSLTVHFNPGQSCNQIIVVVAG